MMWDLLVSQRQWYVSCNCNPVLYQSPWTSLEVFYQCHRRPSHWASSWTIICASTPTSMLLSASAFNTRVLYVTFTEYSLMALKSRSPAISWWTGLLQLAVLRLTKDHCWQDCNFAGNAAHSRYHNHPISEDNNVSQEGILFTAYNVTQQE